VDSNSLLELFDVFGSTLSEGSLSLSVALFALFGGRIDLENRYQHKYINRNICINNEGGARTPEGLFEPK
jgi:hypothetical protein